MHFFAWSFSWFQQVFLNRKKRVWLQLVYAIHPRVTKKSKFSLKKAYIFPENFSYPLKNATLRYWYMALSVTPGPLWVPHPLRPKCHVVLTLHLGLSPSPPVARIAVLNPLIMVC